MTSVYHEGELAVQARAGVQDVACRIGRTIGSTIPPAAREFLARQPMAIIGTIAGDGQVWASMLTGKPGFMQVVDDRTITIRAHPSPGDPLDENLRIDDQVGMIILEPETRRRMRVNGRAKVGPDGTIEIRTRQVYSNCPKYIQARAWDRKDDPPRSSRSVWDETYLTMEQQRWIGEADTFFIASSHRQAGVDASHRGGRPGFVRVLNERSLAWPDYSGNMMFQTLGNIAVNPHAGLLFVDFEHGRTLQLTGRADIHWGERTDVPAAAQRSVAFRIERAIEIEHAMNLRWRFLSRSPFNPEL